MRGALALAALLLLPLAAAQATPAQPSLDLDVAHAQGRGVPDASGQANDATLEGNATLATVAGEPAIAFDGQGLVSTATRLVAPQNLTLAVRFRADAPGGKLAGFENARNGSSASFDRQMYLAEDGRLRFGVWIGQPAIVATSASVVDGAWHDAVGTLSSDGRTTTIALWLDGVPQGNRTSPAPGNYTGYWRFGSGALDRWTNATVPRGFTGAISAARVYDEPVVPQPQRQPQPQPSLAAHASRGASGVAFDVDAAGAPPGARLVAILPDGSTRDVTETRWVEREAQSGAWRFELREGNATLASASVLVLAPLADPLAVAGSVATGVGVVAAGAALSRFDLVAYLRGALFSGGADKLKDRTKDVGALERWVRLGFLAAAAVGVALMALLVSAGKPGSLSPKPFLRALAVAGLATLALKAVTLAGGAWLARREGATPRYRLWTAGTLSLAVTSLVLHTPFGYTGYLARDKPAHAARAALAGMALTLGAVALFLGVGLATRFAFAEVGVTMALGGVATAALPVAPLPGFALWRANRALAALVALAALALYVAYEVGALPFGALLAAGLAGLAAWLALAFVRPAGR